MKLNWQWKGNVMAPLRSDKVYFRYTIGQRNEAVISPEVTPIKMFRFIVHRGIFHVRLSIP